MFLKLRGPEAPVPSALVSPRGSRSRLNWCHPAVGCGVGSSPVSNGQTHEAYLSQTHRRCEQCAPAARAARVNVHVEAEQVVTQVAVGICPPTPGLPAEIVVGQGGLKEMSLRCAISVLLLTLSGSVPVSSRAVQNSPPPTRAPLPCMRAWSARGRTDRTRGCVRRRAWLSGGPTRANGGNHVGSHLGFWAPVKPVRVVRVLHEPSWVGGVD